ncbi:MAG: ABC transporter substrate-binding protein [Oscillospiraceae bacterium]|nr:ABC transporter substrate-binding protein [Oscillospiraceae bacterium]
MEKLSKSFFSAFFSTVLALSFLLIFTGCGKSDKDGSGHVFVYELPVNPYTLDPQTSVADHERLVIMNLFDGLLKTDSEGGITHAVAAEYEISSDKTTYIFYLKKDVKWDSRSHFSGVCTAHDFVFAFKRLFSPEVKSQNSADYFCIANSRQVREGTMPPESLGVVAKDDYTLEIVLESPDENFPLLLTLPPSFPCNEEFYLQTEGRYGLTESTVLSNSGFYLREWVYDPWWTDENRLILRKSAGAEHIIPRGVNFYMDRGKSLNLFASGDSDCVLMGGDGAESLIKKGFPYTTAENSVWGITFNESSVFADENLRLGLAYAADINNADGLDSFTGYKKTSLLIPDGVKIGGEFFRDAVRNAGGEQSPVTADAAVASEHFNKSADLVNSHIAAVGTPVLIVPIHDTDAVAAYVRSVTQQWQEKLSLFCKIEELDSGEYNSRLISGDYDMAAVKITAAYNHPESFFEQFKKAESESADSDGSALYYQSRENELLQSAEFIPLCFMTQYFFRDKKCDGLVYDAFTGAVLFGRGKMY